MMYFHALNSRGKVLSRVGDICFTTPLLIQSSITAFILSYLPLICCGLQNVPVRHITVINIKDDFGWQTEKLCLEYYLC